MPGNLRKSANQQSYYFFLAIRDGHEFICEAICLREQGVASGKFPDDLRLR